MNFLSALGQAANSAYNTGMDITGKVVGGGLNLGSQALSNIQKDFTPPQTKTLPPGIKSPIPQQQVVSHQAPSWLEYGMRNIGQAMTQKPPQQQARPMMSPTPMPTATPTPFPGQNDWVKAQMQRATGDTPQHYNQLYQKAVTQPGFSGNYYGQKPTATPTPTPQQSAVQQVLGAKNQQTLSPVVTNWLETNVFPTTDKLGIPRSVAASQWAVEGGRRTESPINNFYGIGPNWKFDNVQDNVHTYGNTILNILKAKGYNIQGLSPLQVVQALQAGQSPRYEGHNPDPQTYVQTVTGTPEWRYYQ